MKKVVYSILCVTGVMGVMTFLGRWIKSFNMGYFQKNFCLELSGVVLALIVAFILKRTSILKFKPQDIVEGLSAGLILIVLDVIILLGFLGDHDPITESPLNIVMFVLFIFLVGMFEEILFRGIIQNAFHDYFGVQSAGSVRKAIIAASVVFGLTHLTNIFGGGEVLSVVVQAITVIPVGILFGTIYYRSNRNIWVCILMHALNDIVALLRSGILSGNSVTSAINEYSGLKFISIALYGAILVSVMRKEKLQAAAAV